MSDDRAKIAEENAKESAEAVRLANEQKQRDREAGIPTNPAEVQTSIAESIKDKLENDEYSVVVDEAGNHVPARKQE